MMTSRKRRLMSGNYRGRLLVALVFLVCAVVTAVSQAAEIRSVEGLDFNAVVVWGNAEVEISQQDSPGLKLRGRESQLDRQPFYLRGQILHLGRTESGQTADGVQYKVSVVELMQIQLTGSGEVYVRPLQVTDIDIGVEGSGDIKIHRLAARNVDLTVAGSAGIQLAEAQTADLEMQVSGSGSIDLGRLQATQLEVTINGSGEVVAAEEGEAERIIAYLMGSGNVDLANIRVRTADVNIVGSGDALVWAEEELEANIMGSGDVIYHGDPSVHSRVLGSGDVERDE